MKRQRNRGGHGGGHSNNYRGGGGGGGGGGGNRPNVPFRAQTFDSSGPEVRIRGNAYQVLEKYLALARDASASGDRIAAENFYQHAEHYFRLINANQEAYPQQRPQGGQPHPQGGYPQGQGGDPNMAGGGEPPPGTGPQPAGPVVVHTNAPQPQQGDMQAAGPLPSFLGTPGDENR